jgi:hypothetical protein
LGLAGAGATAGLWPNAAQKKRRKTEKQDKDRVIRTMNSHFKVIAILQS